MRGSALQFGKTILGFPAVSRMLVSMKGEIEAARALIFETAVWVDTLKACEQRQEGSWKRRRAKRVRSTTPLVARKKQASNLADMLTPLSKYYATEMGNRVCYKGMQVHGGVGYMKEFNAERHYRDVRITNIYEGTSQLQVVAALGKMVGRGLDVLLDGLAATPTPEGLVELKARLAGTTELFKKCCDALHGCERDSADYFGADLMDMAAVVVNTWLLLRDARLASGDLATRKAEMVRAYAAEHLPRAEGLGAAIVSGDMTSISRKDVILA